MERLDFAAVGLADASGGKPHLLPLYEPPSSCTVQRHCRADCNPSRPRLIYARAIGESTELQQDSDASATDNDDGTDAADSAADGRRRGCGGPGLCAARSLTAFVDAVEKMVKKPRADLQHDMGWNAGGDGAVAAGACDQPPPPSEPRHLPVMTNLWRLSQVLWWGIIHPDSRFRTAWDTVVMNFALVYVALVTTYMLCFEYERESTIVVLDVLDFFVYALFLMDIPINFRTALRHGPESERNNRWLIATNYLTGWFVIDFLAAVPWAYVTQSLGNYLQLLKLLRLIRLLQLFNANKVMQRSKLYMNMEQSQGAAMISVFFYAIVAVIVLHLSASAWYFVAVIENITLEGTWAEAARLEDATNYERYLTSLYFVVITYTTVGYGDVCPVTTLERIISCIGMLIGVATLGYIISTANTIAGNANKYETSKQSMLDNAADFLSAHVQDPRLARHVKRYYRWIAVKQVNDPGDEQMIANMPYGLRYDVLRTVHRPVLEAVPFLRAASQLHEGLVLEICAALKMEYYSRHDRVVEENGWDTEMYFVTSGRLEVRRGRLLTVGDALVPEHPTARVQQAAPTSGDDVMGMYGGAEVRPAAGPNGAGQAVAEAAGEDIADGDPAAAASGGGGGGGGGMGGDGDDGKVPRAQSAQQQAQRSQGSARTSSPFAAANVQAEAPEAADAGGGGTLRNPTAMRLRKHQSEGDVVQNGLDGYVVLQEGAYFGEYSCLTGCPRTATVVATVMSEVFALKRKHLGAAMGRWPELAEVWKACEDYGAELRQARLQLALQGGGAGGKVAPSRGSVNLRVAASFPPASGIAARNPRSLFASGEDRYQDFQRFLDGYIRSRAAAAAGADAAAAAAAPPPPRGQHRQRASLGTISMPTVVSAPLDDGQLSG